MSQISNFQSLNHFSSNFEMSNKEYFKMKWNARLMQFRRLMIYKVETPFGRKKPSGFWKWDVPRVCGLRIDNECLHHRAEQSEQKKWSLEVGSDSSSPFLISHRSLQDNSYFTLRLHSQTFFNKNDSSHFVLFSKHMPKLMISTIKISLFSSLRK